MKSKKWQKGAGILAAALGIVALGSASIASETITYTYDALGRLVTAKSTGATNNNEIRSYCFDKAGNRIQFKADQTGVPASCVTTQ